MTPDELLKPLDVGNGVLAASFGADASWLSVGRTHPWHGYVELSGMPPFPESWRGDVDAVRRYRTWMTGERSRFLWLELPGEDVAACRAGVDDEGRPVWHRGGDGWTCEVTAWAPPGPTVVQRYRIRSPDRVRGVLRVRGRLDRAALAEITEVNPPPPLVVDTDTAVTGDAVELRAAALPGHARVTAVHDDASVGRWCTDQDGGARIEVGGGHEVVITVAVTLRAAGQEDGHGTVAECPASRSTPLTVLDRITRGALRYVRDCTATDTGAILTDHRLLPLSWTRDAYYQAWLLLVADPGGLPVVDRHLVWLFRHAQERRGRWARSQLPDGRSKDRAVQADQQLYPLLELVDYRAAAGRWPGPARVWGPLVDEVWRALPREGPDGLLVSEENPADDRTELPFLLSTQILYWHTATRLATWSAELGLERLQLRRVADGVRSAIHRRFCCTGPFGPQWAYESDGGDGRRRYQDANDLPTALAPLWRFCGVTDAIWTATMRFAFSPHNPAYVPGRLGGLGSAHTPGTWSLGDAQELAVALATGDRTRHREVVRRLSSVVSIDGMLPEAYDPEAGRWHGRHWFAWPGAVIGALHHTRGVPRGPGCLVEGTA